MRDRVVFWLKVMVGVAVTLFCGWLALGALLRLFPPADHPTVVWLNVGVLSFVYGVLWIALIAAALPGGWAERGIWRFTLFAFGFIFMARSRQEKKIEAIRKAGYTVWRPGKRWAVAPVFLAGACGWHAAGGNHDHRNIPAVQDDYQRRCKHRFYCCSSLCGLAGYQGA